MSIVQGKGGSLVPLAPKGIGWNLIKATLGKTGAAAKLKERETEEGRIRRERDALVRYKELVLQNSHYPESALIYASWLPWGRRKLCQEAMLKLPMRPTSKDHDYYVSILERVGAAELLYFHAMRQAEPNLRLWTKVFTALANRRSDLSYVGLIAELEAAGLEPTPIAYSTFLHLARSSKNYEIVEKLFYRMNRRNITITNDTAVPVIGAFMMTGRPKAAVKVLRMLESPDARVIETVMHGLIRNDKYWAAMKYFDYAMSHEIPLDSGLYNAGIEACIAGGRWDRVVEIVDDAMIREDVVLSDKSLLYGMKAFATIGDVTNVQTLFGKALARRDRVTNRHFQILAEGYCNRGLIRGCYSYLRMFIRATTRIKKTRSTHNVDATCFNVMIQECLLRNDLALGLSLGQKMRALGIEHDIETRRLLRDVERLRDEENQKGTESDATPERPEPATESGILHQPHIPFVPSHIEKLLREQEYSMGGEKQKKIPRRRLRRDANTDNLEPPRRLP
ncbi:hypothetical protein NDN08_004139 [Rhodosorus marinus]|uniref:Pentacotripeptide-repeat region of PRORP domain-containing protein n=1 Tax=Rhodosorus marinus TaxID=101924 RepID=A0AAV8UKW3_9RHOD|nr:hypothetical protein NDN08_004139 [Rhodosorus marinus]